jgi:hypothetical protein
VGMLPDCWAAARTVEGSNGDNMLYGMQGMSSDVPEVRSVLDASRCWAAAKPLGCSETVDVGMQGCAVSRVSVLGMLPLSLATGNR